MKDEEICLGVEESEIKENMKKRGTARKEVRKRKLEKAFEKIEVNFQFNLETHFLIFTD